MKIQLKEAIKATALCIRFPFLYPRNRFSGLHYTNWSLHNFHTKWWKYTEDFFMVNFTKEKTTLSPFYRIDDRVYTMWITKEGIIRINLHIDSTSSAKLLFEGQLSDYITGDTVNYGWNGSTPTIVMEQNAKRPLNSVIIFKYLHAPILRKIITFIDWIHEHPVQWFHCIPTYTELDTMDTGWRKAFGIQICKEIKQALLKHGGRKALHAYRIDQIKEKFGTLRWYDSNSCDEVYEIIRKYEKISYRTCVVCGKPATKISTGWICPYCDEHIGDRKYTNID